ncbi:MAG: sulfatase [Planctomycetaceae bacterium]|nr:sulfatase [Planctomycetaceae bacterium]|tara:strand:- start:29429 stop:30823 length:1395 start_codon:yes stop_codon:yes gene_type:complete
MLRRTATGFGALAAAALFAGDSATSLSAGTQTEPFAPRNPHFTPKARNVIFLYMDGGPSQVDSFDPKPILDKEHGNPFPLDIDKKTLQFDNMGLTLKSLWPFKQHGESGIPVSGLFPEIAKHVDKISFVRSMTSKFSEHTFANYFLHTGHGIQGRPSAGSWVTYALGSECRNLPGFIVLNGGLTPPGGLDNFNSGYLPATYQASVFQPGNSPVANIPSASHDRELQRRKLRLIRELDQNYLGQSGDTNALESAIANYEMAARMQTAVPDLADLSGETQATQSMYGLDAPFANTQRYGRICLLARRLIERGVRFIELTCTDGNGDRWDQHSGLREGHTKNALAVDQPIAALITDLEARGLLDETLVLWAGEFGRTPFAQGTNGRDHNPFGFTVWMAGGGVRGGTTYGSTDEFGYKVVENKLEMHDLHATMLHLLGIDHEKLTFRFSGRDMRLTDVHGHVVHDIIA